MSANKIDNKKLFWTAWPAVIIFTALYLIRGNTFEDDAYIFYRYAANWAAGYGPVYNVGEYVEGYSSLLWTIILAIGAFFSFDLVVLAPVLNLFIGITCIILTAYICTLIRFSRPRLTIIILTLLYALSYGFYYFGASGMDTLIFSLVLLLCIISLYKSLQSGNYLLAFLSLILLNISRAEGLVYSVLLAAVWAYFTVKRHGSIPGRLLAAIFAFAAVTILLFAARYAAYGELMPATVLAKGFATYSFKQAVMHGDQAACKDFIRVVVSGLQYESFLFYLGAWIPFIVLLRKLNKADALLWLIAGGIIANIFVTVIAGGDYMPFKRHVIPALPLLIVFTAWAWDLFLEKVRESSLSKKAALYAVAALVLILWAGSFTEPRLITKKYLLENERTLALKQIGAYLHEVPGTTTMLTNMIGIVSYYAGPNVYVRDILGLTDIHNAKHGTTWGFNGGGDGVCGRTDFDYSFGAPFDIFFYNSPNMNKRFLSYCKNNPACGRYNHYISDKWPGEYFYVVANTEHPVSAMFKDKFGAVSSPME